METQREIKCFEMGRLLMIAALVFGCDDETAVVGEGCCEHASAVCMLRVRVGATGAQRIRELF